MIDEPEVPLTPAQREEYLIRAGAYAIKWGVQPQNVRVAWRTWRRLPDGEWDMTSSGDADALLDEVLREHGVAI